MAVARRGRGACLFLFLLLAGCSSGGGGGHRGSSSAAPSLGSVLVAALSTTWQPYSDAMSGAEFALPGAPKLGNQNASGIVERVYTYAFTETAAVSVGVADLAAPDKVGPFVRDYASTLGQEFRASGVRTFSVTEQQATTYATHRAYDMRIVYLPISGARIAPVWFIRLVVSGTHVIVLQTVASSTSSDPTFADTCRALQRRLVGTLRFSARSS